MNSLTSGQTRISEDADSIIDSTGSPVPFDDPRIVYVYMDITNPFTGSLVYQVFKRYGRRCRVAGRATPDVMQYARQLCSGRECIPMTAMTGTLVRDLRKERSPDEITIYFSLDQEGPCQNGAWPAVWETFSRRLALKNAIVGVSANKAKHHFGLPAALIQEVSHCVILGDLFSEAKNALTCLAKDQGQAIDAFEKAFALFIDTFSERENAQEEALITWAENMAGLPLSRPVEAAPKVLIIGGLNLIFVHEPVSRYFLDQDILPKVVDVAEGAGFIDSEGIVRYGFKHGLLSPEDQFSISPKGKNREEAVLARRAKMTVRMADTYIQHCRRLMAPSGLLFDQHIPFLEIIAAGHEYVSNNPCTETSVTTGRYLCTERAGYYHGIVNLGAFNCQPAMNSQAVIRPLANTGHIPYVAIDCEGPWLSVNQRRLLETLAVQAKRRQKEKN